MATNRYTELTPSAYSPMTMQEIMMAPLTKRKQHDETNAAYQQYLSELAKVDPTDRDWEEAVKEKDRISKQILEGTELLNKEGYNNRTSSHLLNLNREYQDSIGATGKIGMFNARKLEKDKAKAEYLDNVVKQGFTAENAQDWLTEAEKDYNQTPVYDDKGRVTGFSTDKYLPPKYKDEEQWRIDLFKNAGIHEEDFARSGSQIVQDEKGNYVINSGRNWGSSTNLPNLEAGLKYIEGELNRKDSDIRKSLNFQRKSIDDVLSNSENLKNVFIKKGTKDQRQSSISNFSPNQGGSEEFSNIYGEDYNTHEVGGNTQDYSEIERIGQTVNTTVGEIQGSNFSPVDAGSGAVATEIKQGGKIFSSEDIKDPRQKALYNMMWNKMSNEGVIGNDGKKIKLTKEAIAKGKNNPSNMKAILNQIKNSPAITLTSKLVTRDVDLNNSGFASSIGKTADERDKMMRKQLKLENSGARKLLDPETGQAISFKEAQKKYNLEDIETTTYHGYVSPLNWEEQSFNGTNSKASPHVITVKTKDGEYKEFKTSRLNSDNVGININRYNDLQENYRNWTINHNEFVDFKSNSPSLSKLKVKYNTINPKVDSKRGILNYEVLDEKGTPHYLNESEFIESVNRTQ